MKKEISAKDVNVSLKKLETRLENTTVEVQSTQLRGKTVITSAVLKLGV